VPRDSSILGPISKKSEPVLLQPFVTLRHSSAKFDTQHFFKQLYLLRYDPLFSLICRKQSTHAISLKKSFYICSLTSTTIIYKGQLESNQLYEYFPDLNDETYKSHFALIHSRFSTNTFPSWDRAQPMRLCAHNGEINTLQGNKNWMTSREGSMKSEKFARELSSIYPIILQRTLMCWSC
jgi:glutamate synthase (NADPH/NADH)